MKLLLLSILCLTCILSFAQTPSVVIKTNKNLLVLDDGKGGDASSIAELKINFTSQGTNFKSVQWEISGKEGKDWEVIKGDLTKKELDIQFKNIGVFDVLATVVFSTGSGDDEEEDEVSDEQEAFLTATYNLDELQQLYADGDWLKLVKKSDNYKVKPKFATDPTPSIYLAKGFYGMYANGVKDSRIAEPYEEALATVAEAMEMELSGVFNMKFHKTWLNDFQNKITNDYIFMGGLEYDSDGFPTYYSGDDKERSSEVMENINTGIEYYSTITKNPFVMAFFNAAIRYNNRDAKGAKAILEETIPVFMKLKKLDKLTDTDKKVLVHGLVMSAAVLTEIDGNNTRSCEIMLKGNEWFSENDMFRSYLTKKLLGCHNE